MQTASADETRGISNLADRLRQRLARLLGSAEASAEPDPRIVELTRELHEAQKEARCRRHIGNISARYFIQHERTPDVAIPFADVTIDSNPEWMQAVLDKRELSEPEFAVFQYFQDPDTTILDIGAHFGYSVASIWAAGSRAAVLSFEPNAWHRPCLERIKQLRPGRYDFITTGLGNAHTSIRFVIPVVEGTGISGLSSAAIETEMDWAIPENVLRYMMQYLPDVASPRLRFTETDWQIAPLDAVLETTQVDVSLVQIPAIKLDVEGYESAVIGGAVATLRKHTPLLMIEGANRNPDVVEQLQGLGYHYGEFHSGQVYLTEQRSTRVGGFFLHAGRLAEYRQMGLLIDDPS